jgi:NADPH-dependent 2,4-dienoyl-CoA reductase/sulfur reductase-like enzyme/nitrite reductase/ring-hydroxylating ferredoxin subunit
VIVRFDELPDGGRIAGRVGDEDVVLARSGDELFAVSAHCTHYHGPLAEGLVVGDTIRCPWHHACFSLRTGSALAAPAHRPLRVFTVTRESDLVRVSADPPPAPPAPAPRGPQRIVIIGGGAAGAFAAFELRRLGYTGSVTLLTRESRVPYDKPNLSKDYLAGRAPEEWIPLRTEADYAADNITLRLGAEVASIDTAAHEVSLADGERLAYDRLILAPGASPRRLDLAGPVRYLRTWNDADGLRAATAEARRAVIIGASFIGLETAASLRERGLEVTVIGAEERPLEKVLGRELAAFVQRTHESHGVRFRLGRHPVEIRSHAVVLDDGSAEACDVVIAGIGVTPDVGLAERAGLAVDNGIVVDEYLQTSAPDVFAAGDAARYPRGGKRIRVEHWVAAGRQGQAAARNALGRREPFTAAPFFWSQHYDLVIAYVGHAASAAGAETFGSWDAHDAAAVYREEGKVAAVATLFRDDISLAVEAAMERGEDVLDIVRRGFGA